MGALSLMLCCVAPPTLRGADVHGDPLPPGFVGPPFLDEGRPEEPCSAISPNRAVRANMGPARTARTASFS